MRRATVLRHSATIAILVVVLASAARGQNPGYNTTYFGGPSSQRISAVAEADGEVYIVGVTLGEEIPGVAGGAQERPNSEVEIFVARLSRDLSKVLQATYFGGTAEDQATALAVTADAVYIAGWTRSTDLPATAGSAQPSWSGHHTEAFVARLSRDLRTIERTSYLGGSDLEAVLGMAVGPTGVFVTGDTYSNGLASPGSAQPLKAGPSDAFVARFDADLTTVRTTYLGGSWMETGYAIAVSRDSLYVAGSTSSRDFPRTGRGAQPRLATLPGASIYFEDAFVAKLDLDLNLLRQSTYLGGGYPERARSLALSPDGWVYVLGETASKDFPFTLNGAQPLFADPLTEPVDLTRSDGFLAKLSAGLTHAEQATYVGGQGRELYLVLLVDAHRVLVAGSTESQDFPATEGGFMEQASLSADGFVASLATDLRSFSQSTYFGGNRYDAPLALAARRHPTSGDILEIYLAGQTLSSDLPYTAGTLQPDWAGVWDGFVARIDPGLRE
jgi:hypothetical protein